MHFESRKYICGHGELTTLPRLSRWIWGRSGKGRREWARERQEGEENRGRESEGREEAGKVKPLEQKFWLQLRPSSSSWARFVFADRRIRQELTGAGEPSVPYERSLSTA